MVATLSMQRLEIWQRATRMLAEAKTYKMYLSMSYIGNDWQAEAANMVKYQQAYQACAQMIQTSGLMFTSLITAITDG